MSERIDKIKRMLEEQGTDSFLLFALAKEYSNREEWQAALDTFERLYAWDADYVGAYYHWAAACVAMEQREKAMHIYELGIQKASALKDEHAKAELMNARMNVEIEL